MGFITGQEVFNKFELDYQQLADAVLKGKIKCYNDDHKEIIDASAIKEKENLCSYGRILSFSINIPNMFFIYPDFLEESEVVQIDSYTKLLQNTEERSLDLSMEPTQYQNKIAEAPLSYKEVKKIITKDGATTLDEKDKLFALSTGIKLCYNGIYFSFANYLDKDNSLKTNVTIEIPDLTLVKTSIPFKFVVYSYKNEDINKFLFHLNTINEIYRNFESNNLDYCYSSVNSTKNEEYEQQLFFNLNECMIKFYNDCESLPYLNNMYLNNMIKYLTFPYDEINIKTNLSKYFDSIFSLYKKFLNRNINEILKDNLDYNLNNILSFEKKENVIQQVSCSNINKTELQYKLCKKDEDKLYVSLDENIISHNGIVLFTLVHNEDNIVPKTYHIDDTFYKDFEKNKEQLINNKSKKLIESFEYAKNYQIIHRNFYPNKEFKKDYYYFDINEFLKFYPKEYSAIVKEFFYKKNIYSFYFKVDEITEYYNKLKKLKHYTIKLDCYSADIKNQVLKLYSHCKVIFCDYIKNNLPYAFFEEFSNAKDKNEFLIIFFIYYNKLLNQEYKKRNINNEKIFDTIQELGIISNTNIINSQGNKKTYITRYDIHTVIVDGNNNKEYKNADDKRRKVLFNKYNDKFPFIKFTDLSNKEEVILKIKKYEKNLKQLNLTINFD